MFKNLDGTKENFSSNIPVSNQKTEFASNGFEGKVFNAVVWKLRGCL